jgi:hypothetical protein
MKLPDAIARVLGLAVGFQASFVRGIMLHDPEEWWTSRPVASNV